jgi:thiol-disulfide isomerase/thioredoxin
MAYDQIIQNQHSLFPEVIDSLRKISNCTSGIEYVEKINNKYIAIENREYDSSVFKSSDILKDISEGEQLLKKILEPLKGKFVLLDIWGTWCKPCKDALKHSAEEYAYLRDFDIEYLYLAYDSPKELWERVVKVYNVMGDNVSHYNLPDKQQIAIQRYLKVTSFPSYKLFDRDGNLVDVKVDARDLEGIAKLLKQLK